MGIRACRDRQPALYLPGLILKGLICGWMYGTLNNKCVTKQTHHVGRRVRMHEVSVDKVLPVDQFHDASHLRGQVQSKE